MQSGYHCLEAVDHARRARAEHRRRCSAAASCTRSGTGTRRCSRTRWRPSTSSRVGGSCSGSAAAGTRASTTRTASRSRRSASAPQVDEAIQCVRRLLTEDVANFDGEFFKLRDARCEPKPVQERLPLWIGGGGEKVTLRIAAQHADGWNVAFIAPETTGSKVDVLDEHCEAFGRDPAIDHEVGEPRARVERRRPRAQFGGIAEFIGRRAHGQRRRRWSTASASTATPAPTG